MSVEFVLTESSLSLNDWASLVDGANDWDLYDHSDPDFGESGVGHYMVEGSVRGVTLYHDGPGLITLRMGALSSRADWVAAYALIASALGQGGGTFTREDGTAFGADELTPALAREHALTDFCATVGMMCSMLSEHAEGEDEEAEGLGEVALPVGDYALPVRAEDLAAPCDEARALALEEKLAAQVARYNQAYSAMTMNLDGGVRVSTWAQIATVVGNGAHLIHCSAFDSDQGLIPVARLAELLGDRLERLGGRGFYLPELELGGEPELRAQIEETLICVEDWAAANQDVLAREAEERAQRTQTRLLHNEGDEEWEAYRGLLRFVMGGVAADQPPNVIVEALVEKEVPEEVATNMVSLIGMTLDAIFSGGEPRDPGEVFMELNAQGVPSGLAALALEVIGEACAAAEAGLDEDPTDDDGDEDPEKD